MKNKKNFLYIILILIIIIVTSWITTDINSTIDDTDYYTYEFSKEKGKEIEEELIESHFWSKEKLAEDIIDCFKYNNEVLLIENGYYHYELVCRTSDGNKKYNFTDEEVTGYEVGVYDANKNMLYYYWTSY